jgi:flavin-dependent thymidylate synthase
MSHEIARIADVAMYEAEPDEGSPRVTLLSMTPNPLREIAAAAEMYRGHVVREVGSISRTQAEGWLADMMRTGTRAPLEFVNFHFLFEGVTRGFTHQLVRQRTATYVQESTRFAVKRHAVVVMPPSIARLKEDAPARILWDSTVEEVAETYMRLVDMGIPAEDARGLLPTNLATKIHYRTNLRDLMEHAGLRLCSQAQYEWKQVWAGILQAIQHHPYALSGNGYLESWQYDAIASLFKPICYHTGKCEFMAATDRYCPIRTRVEAHHERGDSPDKWVDINPLEALVEGAARQAPGQEGK